jgi:hypothetical protein
MLEKYPDDGRVTEAKSPSMSEVYKNPDVHVEPDYSAIPVDFSALQPFNHPTPSVAISESDDLRITIEQEEWHAFDHRALIVGLSITVVNKSRREHALTGVSIQAVEPWKLLMHDTDADREKFRYQMSRPQFHGASPPGQTTIGWVWWMFEPRIYQGRPGYTIWIGDEVGNRYELSVAARFPETFGGKADD